MIDNNNSDKDFSFIQEEIVPKKTKKIKVFLIKLLLVIIFGIIFGVVASITFYFLTPDISEILDLNNEETNNKTSVTVPIASEPSISISDDNNDKDDKKDNLKDKDNIEKEEINYLENYIKTQQSLIDIANKVNKSIVTIKSIINTVDWFNNPYQDVKQTAGVIIASTEKYVYILYSYGTIDETTDIEVVFNGSKSVKAQFINCDKDIGIAIIGVKLKHVPDEIKKQIQIASLGESYTLSVGEPIIALGSPNGYMHSIMIGMVTNNKNYVYIVDNKIELFNTDITDIENGEGIIVNMDGNIIGIITHNFKTNLNENINTVLSISKQNDLIEALINDDKLIYLGINASDLTPEVAKDLEVESGVYVTETKKDSPAYIAGIQSGDVILSIDENKVMGMMTLNNIINNYSNKDIAKFHILRTSKGKDVYIDLDVQFKIKPN